VRPWSYMSVLESPAGRLPGPAYFFIASTKSWLPEKFDHPIRALPPQRDTHKPSWAP
jgi:hypothetical protein